MRIASRLLPISSTLIAAGLVVSGLAAHAQTNLATGLDVSNTLITTGVQADAHWTVPPQAGGSAVAAQTVYPGNADYYGGWLANGPNSDWIARDATIVDNGPASYTFSRTFDLTGFDVSTAAITGSWTIDDQGTLDLNGNNLGTLSSGDWTSLHSFSVPTGSAFFNPGLNTLNITITSDDRFLEAVRLEGTLTATALPAAVPEPGSLALLIGLGATGSGFLARRRQKVRKAS